MNGGGYGWCSGGVGDGGRSRDGDGGYRGGDGCGGDYGSGSGGEGGVVLVFGFMQYFFHTVF